MRKKREEKFITIREVAEEAGVSIATVSRVINNGNVRNEKKKKVYAAIKKLDYVPNESARNLAAVSVTKKIALILPGIDKNYYVDIAKGSKSIMRTYYYDVLIDTYDYDPKLFAELHKRYEVTSDHKVIIQIGEDKQYESKTNVDIQNENILYRPLDLGKTVSIFAEDTYMESFLLNKLFKNAEKYNENVESDLYIAPALTDVIALYNKGVTDKPIYTFENIEEISKIIPNVKHMNFDFYGLGVALSRVAIKLTRKESINKVLFTITGIEE